MKVIRWDDSRARYLQVLLLARCHALKRRDRVLRYGHAPFCVDRKYWPPESQAGDLQGLGSEKSKRTSSLPHWALGVYDFSEWRGQTVQKSPGLLDGDLLQRIAWWKPASSSGKRTGDIGKILHKTQKGSPLSDYLFSSMSQSRPITPTRLVKSKQC